MSYIYITGWDKYQHYKNRRPPWIKFYVDLLANDEWLNLSPSNVKLLCTLWMLAATHGDGRVTADERWLTAQAKTPKGSLKALSDAGFITIRASKAASALEPQSKRTDIDTDIPLTPQAGNLRSKGLNPRALGTNPRAAAANENRTKAVATCRRLYNDCVAEGDQQDAIREHLEREYRHDPSIVLDAVPEWRESA
jgi:hypothetical protein